MGRSLTTISFLSQTHSRKKHGFADYSSRNPTAETIPPTDEDKNFVIKTIEEIKLFITTNSLSPNGASNSFSPR